MNQTYPLRLFFKDCIFRYYPAQTPVKNTITQKPYYSDSDDDKSDEDQKENTIIVQKNNSSVFYKKDKFGNTFTYIKI